MSPDQTYNKDTTLGITTTGCPSLIAVISAVLASPMVPRCIHLHFDGDTPHFGDFYLEQLSALAKSRGCSFKITVDPVKGVRQCRDYLIAQAETKYLWMLDDDALPMAACFTAFVFASQTLDSRVPAERWAYVNGSKPDITNRRGYGDFVTKEVEEVNEWSSHNFFYSSSLSGIYRTHALDTGNVLFNVEMMRSNGLKFSVFPDSVNSGGEDTLMALLCRKAGLSAYFCPTARAVHLEKPAVRFGEHPARLEMVLRACDQLGLDKDVARKILFPWLSK